MPNFNKKHSFLSFNVVPSMEVTHYLDDATWNLIKDDLDSAVDKTVALTGPATVGFGSSGDKLYGTIGIVELDQCVRVKTGFFMEGVYLGSANPNPGEIVVVDGSGGLESAPDQDGYGPTVVRVDDASETGLDYHTAVIKTA